MKRVVRTDVRQGYDLWARSYDATPNPLVDLDRRFTLSRLAVQPGERVLDAACGTGANLRRLREQRADVMGVDLSRGMLGVARQHCSVSRLVQADLEREIPVRRRACDAVLCSLAGEHMTNLPGFFREAHDVLVPEGRFAFSVLHPDRCADGREGNFDDGDTNYRLGAERHTEGDYLQSLEDAGFRDLRTASFAVDQDLADRIPRARKYLGLNLLWVVTARRTA